MDTVLTSAVRLVHGGCRFFNGACYRFITISLASWSQGMGGANLAGGCSEVPAMVSQILHHNSLGLWWNSLRACFV